MTTRTLRSQLWTAVGGVFFEAPRLARFTVTALIASLCLPASAGAGLAKIRTAQDTNPRPKVFETRIVAREAMIDLDRDGQPESVFAFNGTIPGPQIDVNVGDTVTVRFKNELPLPSSIHWHGIEVNNKSDGTPVTQNEVLPGGSYTYRFKVTRPGIFWYHPHIKPSNQVWKGLYGPIIVTDKRDKKLKRRGVLPRKKRTLMLADVTVCKEPGANDFETFPQDESLPWSGPSLFPGNNAFPVPRDLCETPLTDSGRRLDTPLAAGVVPNVQPGSNCAAGFQSCRVNMGQWVLTNGVVPAARGGSPSSPGPLGTDAETIDLMAGEGLRLQVVNAAIHRYFRLRLTNEAGWALPLFRVGGEGGLLDKVRLEGGKNGSLVTKYDKREVLLAPANRADLVLLVRGRVGEILTLWTRDYSHTGSGFARTPTVPVLHIRIVGTLPAEDFFKLRTKTPLLTDPRINRPVETLPVANAKLLDPEAILPSLPGTANRKIRLTAPPAAIDGIVGGFDHASTGDYRDVPHIRSTRYARVGDLLTLEVANETMAHHPFHLHGFSFQPIRMKRGGKTLFRYKNPEFVDTVDIQPGHTLEFRVRLDDRPTRSGQATGGAVGRWLFHCHIFPHAALGMIGELMVLPVED